MTREGRAPLDHNRDETPAAPFLDVERRSGAVVGEKEMTLTRRPRAEPGDARAARFMEIERRGEEN